MNIENKVYVAQAIPVSDSYLPQAQYCPTPASAPELTNPGAREFLSSKKWPIGLQETFIRNLSLIPIRFFICDDSGSMMASDGHRLMQTASGQQRYVQCTRWEELTDALRFHANLAHEAGAPTEFRLLNGHKSIRVGTTDAQENRNLSELLSSFDKSPGGRTPLCKHIHEITEKIARMKTQLLNAGQKACVIIATDGESSDGDIVAAMQRLRTLPVWVVVRLCTDEDRIVNYWNNIDAQLELDMDVLDDLCGEAAEVAANNPWLTYGEPLHRLREFGVLIKEIDMMDSDKLSLDQIRKVCTVIFGGTVDSYPHPELDFNGFLTALNRQNQLASKVWDPVSRRLHSWIRRGPLYRMHPIYICTVS